MVDSQCLACYTDGIWYPATVTDVKDDLVSVHFDDYGEDMEVDMTQVVPSGESVRRRCQNRVQLNSSAANRLCYVDAGRNVIVVKCMIFRVVPK